MADEIKKIGIKYTADVTDAISNLAKLEKKLENLQGIAGTSKYSKSVGAKQAKAQEFLPGRKEFAKELKRREAEQAKISKENVNRLASESKAQEKIREAQAKAESKFREQRVLEEQRMNSAYEKAMRKQMIDDARAAFSKDRPARMIGYTDDTTGRAEYEGSIRSVSSDGNLQYLANGADKASSKLKSLTVILHSLKDTLKATFSLVGKLGSALGSLAKSSFGKLASSVKNTTKGMANLWNSLKRIAMYRALRSMIKAITDGFNQGVENAYRWAQANNNQLATSLDSLATTSLYLKNSIGAMAAPLINMLAPAIATVVDWVVTLINALNRLFAMLGGQGTWIKATKQATNYKDAVGGASKALKSFTIGIDELNILEDNGGGGGGGASADAGGMFEEVALGASALRDAISNGEWMNVGKLIAESINDSIAKIDANLIGLKIGGKIENAIELAYGFIKTINTRQIGTKIAEFINSGLKAIDTNLLGKTIAEEWNRVFDLVGGFAETLGWSQIGEKIGGFISGAFTNFNAENAANSVNALLNGILEAGIKAVDTTPWSAIGVKIAAFFSTMDWKGILSGALTLGTKFINGLLETIISTLNTGDWSKFGNDIKTAIADYITSGEFGKLLSNLPKLVISLEATVEKILWDEIPEEMFTPLNTAIMAVIPAYGGLLNSHENLKEAIEQDTPIISEAWENTKEDVSLTIGQFVATTEESWEEMLKNTKEQFSSIYETVTTKISDMKITSSLTVGELAKNIKEKWDYVKTHSSSIWATVKADLMTKWYELQLDAVSKFVNIKSSITSKFLEVKNDLATTWDSIQNKILETWDAIKSGISERVSAILTNMETFLNGMIDKINPAIEKLNELLSFDVGGHSFGVEISTIEHVSLQGRASGGFMESGQVYTVREGGIPEFVGSYGNRAAVANNDQIVEGIAGGVSVANEEVVAALNTLIGVVSGMDLSVNIGDKEIGQANERYTQSRGVYVNKGSFVGAY